MNLKEFGNMWKGLEEGKGREELCNYILIL